MVEISKSEIDNNSDGENQDYERWSILEEGETTKAELPLPEEKERDLTFERMSELTTEQYLELWRSLNPFYVTHVTRQGIRDHTGMIYHSAGVGSYLNGFKDILSDGKRLCSPAKARYGLPPDFTEEDVARVLEELVFSSDEFDGWSPIQILNTLPFNFSIASADPWADKQAIHFAQHTVLNDYYGGERGNEAFFVFPTDVVVSQCQFGGHMHSDLITAQVRTERKWNDMFVWPKSGEIPIDAGLVFLPKSQMVDRRTGSRYALEEMVDADGNISLEPKKDEARIESFKRWVMGLSEDSPEIKAANDGDLSPLKSKLLEIGIPEECVGEMVGMSREYEIISFIADKHFGNLWMSREELEKMTPEEKIDYSVRKYLSAKSADLKFAEDAIPAEEYWEQYFAEHPEQRPAHVIYYDGDPSGAIRTLLYENGILKDAPRSYYGNSDIDFQQTMTGPGDSSERDGKMLGFEGHFIRDGVKDERLASEHKRFNELALKILRERLGGENSGD